MDAVQKPRTRLDGVTMLRFVAAFYVFIFHMFSRVPADVPSFLGSFLYNGPVGMSFFFILSGFVLTYNYGETPGKNYFAKRLIRIYPAYLLCGLLTYQVLIHQIISTEHNTLKFLVTNLLFLTATQSWLYTTMITWNFGGTWSVSVEMFFYAVFPFLLALLNKKNVWIFAAVAFLAAALIMPVATLYQAGLPNENLLHFVLYSGPMYRLPEFAMGMAAAKLMSKGLRVNHIAMVGVLAALVYALNQQSYGWMMHAYIIVPAFCGILIYVSTNTLPAFIKPIAAPFKFFGEISYSFYLMQVVVIVWVAEYRPPIISGNGFTGWIIAFAITTALAYLSYYFVEKKLSIVLLKALERYSEKRDNRMTASAKAP
ncbi:acyltransferase family protein [Pseudomonas sp. URMO17WK12:I11]|uniref:acyltransferase family protein n=1 Tax=Pseudomonas sp. URMO17WK12:I11 TaxID=1283291 RepID=UPI00072103A9|nr:acyltransferase [Pseudomonas sp. URMO17WK12:I11]CRL47664.1 O-acetyltransferase OatA [Pseudomonas sp. URMO17WK12:I11]